MQTTNFNRRVRDLDRRSRAYMMKYMCDPSADTEELAVNACGECSLCCTIPAISAKEFRSINTPAKPYGRRCVHCFAAGGCSIHYARPEVCRGYQCLWKLGLTDNPPCVTGVAWAVEPNKDSRSPEWAVVGQCLDTDEVLSSADLMRELRQTLTMTLLSLPVGCVILRSSRKLVKVLPGKDYFEEVDIVQDGQFTTGDLSTLKKLTFPELHERAFQTV